MDELLQIVKDMQAKIPQEAYNACEGKNYDFISGPAVDAVEDTMNGLATALCISWEQALLILFGTVVDRNT